MIQDERIQALNNAHSRSGAYVLYWMQQSARAHYNHALELAVEKANSLKIPLLVLCVLTDSYPEANLRHYRFLLEGFEDTRRRLADRGIRLLLLQGEPLTCVPEVARQAALLVCDRGYLRFQRQWRAELSRRVACPCLQVESDVLVPVEAAYPKQAYTAGILRPKLHALLERFLIDLPETPLARPSLGIDLNVSSFNCKFVSQDLDLRSLEGDLKTDQTVRPVEWIEGGTSAALQRLEEFLAGKIDKFHQLRNDPSRNYLSHLSPYLHFGQISPLYIALQVRAAAGAKDIRDTETDGETGGKTDGGTRGETSGETPALGEGAAAFLEELIVRRELAMNFAYYNQNYDNYNCLPNWAQTTLAEHEVDRRDYLYSLPQLEAAETHDPYWNAAQTELRVYGKMHGYMRMYWGKKILEWSPTPRKAYERALYLNNKYSLDGRDANGYAGVGWCFGLHDRAWPERPVFGKTRYMNANGLKRKFNIEAYVQKLS
ncbi:MAG TPA: deoxyribodipyrimidine photo-lyase [Clostridia bacterium]|nr:deoxyribodipyrimidine photo-lyase [Clostridia bacterium]